VWSLEDADSLGIDRKVIYYLMRLGHIIKLKDFVEFRVLYHHGGIFLDTDIICLRPFDEIAYRYTFIGSVHPYTNWDTVPSVNVGVVGGSKGSPILKKMNEMLDAYWWNRTAYKKLREPIRPGEHQFLWAYQL